jgi:diguanylate cyclase (GGDEF)-like protein/PAS domain S-box-containing protein
MPSNAESQLNADNAALRERLAELETRLNDQTAHDRDPEYERFGAAVKASETRYRRLFESAKDGILILDADSGVIIDANPYLEVLLDYSHNELVGKKLWELGLFRDIAASRESFQRLQATEYSRHENLPLETRTKEIREVEFVSNVYLVNGARVIQCNIRDITERRRIDASLRAANTDLAALVSQLKKRDSEMQSLFRMNDLLQTCSTQEEAYRVIVLMVDELFTGLDGGLAIRHEGHPDYELIAHWGETTQMAANFTMDDCWGMRRGQPHEVLEPQSSLLCRHFVAEPKTGYLCIPLAVQGESLGLLCLMADSTGTSEHQINRRNLALMLSESIKLSLFNLRLQEKLRNQATRDPLTGLFNRRYLDDSLDRELHRAQRMQSPLSVVMLDLDHFKHFNDNFGHDAGDLLLRELGSVLSASLRQGDISCRYGGEEFVLVFPDSSLADTQKRVEEIRKVIKGLEVRHGERMLGPITVSAGVAAAPEHGYTAAELMWAADGALYAAKQSGRDRLVAYKASA